MIDATERIRAGHDAVARAQGDLFLSERAPYVPHEHPSTRGYVLARRRP